MARMHGVHYPERASMAVISDLLGIPHFSTSNGGTVRSDFLEAALGALQVPNPSSGDKDFKIRRLWEVSQKSRMPEGRLSRGGTVTNTVLNEIAGGIIKNRLNVTGLDSSATTDIVDPDDETFDPDGLVDTRERRLALQAIRQGQSKFRMKVLLAYGDKCAVTKVNVVSVLDAAHIHPYVGSESNHVTNGILLRTDLHRLFDRHFITIDEASMRIIVSPLIKNSPGYEDLGGTKISLPNSREQHPSIAALEGHHREFEQKLEAQSVRG